LQEDQKQMRFLLTKQTKREISENLTIESSKASCWRSSYKWKN